MISEKNIFFLSFSHYKSMGANDPRGLIGRFYITLLHTKYITCGPHDFREDFF